ncbi:YolD-like family protein [Paenibacillus jamilae]|uniref:YolD-like family protein n=1 Tax=Paenibacillus jamilae TaxID=114136 RepID=UPI000A809FB3|nr:YolD-like family protein [Paenibacillus jamilae]
MRNYRSSAQSWIRFKHVLKDQLSLEPAPTQVQGHFLAAFKRLEAILNDTGSWPQKWTALMLPEHKERLQQWALSQEDVSQPVLDEDQLQSINKVVSL